MTKKLSFDFCFESSIIGIVSTLADYRMAYFINENLNINLSRIEDHEVYDEKNSVLLHFSQYYFLDELNKREYYFIKNKVDFYCCLPEFKSLDYLLFSPVKINPDILTSETAIIKSILNVQAVTLIYPEQVKNKENVYLDANTF